MLHYTMSCREKYNKDIRKAKNVQVHVTTMLQLIPCTTPNKSLSHIPTKNGQGSRLWKMTVGPKNVYRAACNHQTECSANGKYYSIWDVPAMHLKKTPEEQKKEPSQSWLGTCSKQKWNSCLFGIALWFFITYTW